MFDKNIQDKLNRFADSQKPSPSILNNALAELEKDKKKVKTNKVQQWRYVVVPLILLIVMGSFVGGGLWYADSRSNNGDSIDKPLVPSNITISLSDMYIDDVDITTLEEYRQLTLNGYAAVARGYYAIDTDKLIVVSVKYRKVSASGISEVLVVSEEDKYSCKELQYLHKKNQYIDYYIDGEYKSFNHYNDINRNYWTFIQSSYMAGNEVMDNMFD